MMPGDRKSAGVFRSRFIIECVFFLALAIASTWPLAEKMGHCLPLGTEDAATVPLFNVWTVWWNSDRLASGYKGYWNAPIFHPAENTFAFSEPQPLSALAAPVIWVTGNRVFAYNVLLLAYVWLNGLAAYSLLYHLHFHRLIAVTGAVMIELLPLIHSWLGVLQLVPVFGILWTFWALHKFGRRPTVLHGILFGACYGLVYLLCSYYGLFLVIPLMTAGFWLVKDHMRIPKMWASLLLGGLSAMMLVLPVVLMQHRFGSAVHQLHDKAYLMELSADIVDYLFSPWPQLIKIDAFNPMEKYAVFKLNPGFIKAGLAAAGIGWGIASRKRRQWMLFCVTMLCVSFVLSLGPSLEIIGWNPYMLLVKTVPGFGQARNVFRFAVFVQLSLVLLSVLGLQSVVELMERYALPTSARRMAYFALILIAATAVTEVLPARQQLYETPVYSVNHAWIDWLTGKTPANSVIACAPFPFKPDVVSYEREAIWMYWQTFHKRIMVNGYSGFFPKRFLDLKMEMVYFPEPEIIDHLVHLGVTCCVVGRDSEYGERTRQYAGIDPRMELVFSDARSMIDIYRIGK